MEVASAVAILLLLTASPYPDQALGQRPPCKNCDTFRDSPLQEIRAHCIYPCECDSDQPVCDLGVAPVRDGCGCCPICPRQIAQSCDKTTVCDEQHGLYCHYAYVGASTGVCQGRLGLPCTVANTTYGHGETFHVDCRTQCTCQNGTYACSSLCPNEIISPRAACEHPRLVDVPDQCCREWMCDSTEAEHPPTCKQEFTSWSDCSVRCGLGSSHRMSNVNECVLMNETRICQLRPCETGMLTTADHSRHHHIRKGHECKATQRVAGPVRLRFGPCRSKKRYRPRFCGHCADRAYDGCCIPQLSTTIRVEFLCDASTNVEDVDVMDLIEPGRDLWWPDDLLALKLVNPTTPSSVNDSQVESSLEPNINDNIIQFRKNFGWLVKRPIYQDPGKLQNIEQDVYRLGRTSKSDAALKTSTEKSSTSKPRKRRKKKRTKPFTSWLEFRDEEYEMDEYEDYEETEERPKRSLKKKSTGKMRRKRDFGVGSELIVSRTIKTGKQDGVKLAIEKWQKFAETKKGSKRKRDRKEDRVWTGMPPGDVKHLSKRIMRGQSPVVNQTRWNGAHASKRKRRQIGRWVNQELSDHPSVVLNVQWIVKCACDRACALATTTPSELSADGEIVLRRVHRTAPP